MELGLQSFENPMLSPHKVSASKGWYDHKHSEHLLGDAGEDSGLYQHKYRTNSCIYRFKIPTPFSLWEGFVFRLAIFILAFSKFWPNNLIKIALLGSKSILK